MKHSRGVPLRFEPAANAASLSDCCGRKTLRTTLSLQGRDECLVSLDDTRDSRFAAGEHVTNAPQAIRVEPNRRYMEVPLHQHVELAVRTLSQRVVIPSTMTQFYEAQWIRQSGRSLPLSAIDEFPFLATPHVANICLTRRWTSRCRRQRVSSPD